MSDDSAIALVPHTPAPLAHCPYLDRCNSSLTSGGCATCRFNFARCYAEGCHTDSGSRLSFVAISLTEAAR